jgi:hypothetical protein
LLLGQRNDEFHSFQARRWRQIAFFLTLEFHEAGDFTHDSSLNMFCSLRR